MVFLPLFLLFGRSGDPERAVGERATETLSRAASLVAMLVMEERVEGGMKGLDLCL